MLKVTEGAKELLRETLLGETDDPEIGLRLLREESGQLRLKLDKEELGDQVVEYEGVNVLLVKSELAAELEGITLDVQDNADGVKKLVVISDRAVDS